MARSSRLALVALLAVAGVGFVVWKVAGTRDRASGAAHVAPRVEPELEREAAGVATSPAPVALAGGVELERPAAAELAGTDEVAPGRSSAGAGDRALADALWVRGRVVFPAGTPPDERARVVAYGKQIEGVGWHGTDVSIAIGDGDGDGDGTFRVAFHPETTRGWLALEARYAYLSERFELDPRETREGLVLEPQLGGCLVVTVHPPPGLAPDDPRPEAMSAYAIAQRPGRQSTHSTARAAVSADGTYVAELGSLAPDVEHSVSCSFDVWKSIMPRSVLVAAGARKDLVLEASVGIAIQGRAVDPGGAPLAEAVVKAMTTVTLGRDTHAYSTQEFRTDANGRFALRGLQDGTTAVHARLSGRRPAELDLGELADGARVDGIELVLDPGRSVAGRVVWPDGANAVGAEVRVREPEAPGRSSRLFALRPDAERPWTSGDDGRFEITGLGDGPYRVVASAERASNAAGDTDAPWLAELDGVEPDTQGLVLTLDTGQTIEGTVVDQDGAAVRAFEVTASPAGLQYRLGSQSPDALRKHRFESDAGRFTLRGLPMGHWSLSASADGHAPTAELVVTLPVAKPIELVVQRGVSIAGRVVDPSGRGIAGAEVKASVQGPRARRFGSGRKSWSNASVVSTADGSFAIDALGPGSVRVEARKAGFARGEPLQLELAPGAAEDGVLVPLLNGGRIEGRLHPRPGLVLQEQTISLRPPMPTDTSYMDHARTDAEGRFTFADVPPGEYALRGDTDQALVTVEGGRTVEVVLGLPIEGGARILGRVTRAGRPVSRANVNAYPMNGSSLMHEAETDADGAYEVTLPAPGLYWLHVSFNGASTSRQVEVPESGETRQDLELATGVLHGKVLAPDGSPAPGVHLNAQSRSASSGSGQSGSDGTFQIDGLADGTYVLQAMDWHEFYGGMPYVSPKLELVIAGGRASGDVELRLERPCTVAGRVTLPDGRPAIGARVALVPVQSGEQVKWATTDGSGRYRLFCAEGEWRARATKDALSSSTGPVVRSRLDDDVELDLALVQGTVVQVVIAGVDEEIWAHVVEVGGATQPFPFNPRDPTLTAVGGEPRGWRVGPLPPGTYRVSAQRRSTQTVAAEGTFTVNGEEFVEVVLKPEE